MQNIYSHEEEYGEVKQIGLGRVFAYLFGGLLITSLISIITYRILNATIEMTDAVFEIYFGVMIGAMISIFVLIIGSQIALKKDNAKWSLICFVLYTIAMGILLSSLMLEFELAFLGLVFLAAAGSFGAMALYGLLSKKNEMGLGMVGSGFLMGAIILSIMNWFIGSEPIYYLISFIGLIAMLAFTAYDVNRAKNLAENGLLTKAYAIFMALQIYIDFVYIFLRLVIILGRNRK